MVLRQAVHNHVLVRAPTYRCSDITSSHFQTVAISRLRTFRQENGNLLLRALSSNSLGSVTFVLGHSLPEGLKVKTWGCQTPLLEPVTQQNNSLDTHAIEQYTQTSNFSSQARPARSGLNYRLSQLFHSLLRDLHKPHRHCHKCQDRAHDVPFQGLETNCSRQSLHLLFMKSRTRVWACLRCNTVTTR